MSLGQNAEPGDWSGYRVPGCKRWGLWLGLSTIPFIFAFHLVDLALTIESHILSVVQR